RFVVMPENRPAWLAVQDVGTSLTGQNLVLAEESTGRQGTRRLLIHGPAGTGKTHLVYALVAAVTRQRPDIVVNILAGGEVMRPAQATLFAGDEDNASPR